MFGLKLRIEKREDIKQDDLDGVAEECAAARKEISNFSRKSAVRWLPGALSRTMEMLSELQNICRNFSIDEEILNTFIPLEQREIKEEYTRIGGGIALIVDG